MVAVDDFLTMMMMMHVIRRILLKSKGEDGLFDCS